MVIIVRLIVVWSSQDVGQPTVLLNSKYMNSSKAEAPIQVHTKELKSNKIRPEAPELVVPSISCCIKSIVKAHTRITSNPCLRAK